MTKEPDDYEEHLISSGLDPEDLEEEPDEYIDPTNGYTQISIEELDQKIEKDIKGFKDLLDTLSSTEERKKSLWKQIYENAVTDRKNAFILFGDLYTLVNGKSSEHAIHGQVLSKYMERMSKANEQLIKLADLVSNAVDEETSEQWDEETMFDMLKETSKSKTSSGNKH